MRYILSIFVHVDRGGYVKCPHMSTRGGEGVKNGQNLVYVVVECPLTEPPKTCKTVSGHDPNATCVFPFQSLTSKTWINSCTLFSVDKKLETAWFMRYLGKLWARLPAGEIKWKRHWQYPNPKYQWKYHWWQTLVEINFIHCDIHLDNYNFLLFPC